MTFLSKFGAVVLKIIGVATGLMPIIDQSLPAKAQGVVTTVTDKLGQAFNVVVTAEQMFTAAGVAKAGSQKLAAATPFVAQLVQQTELLSGKHVKNDTLFQDASTRLTAALADILNSFGE